MTHVIPLPEGVRLLVEKHRAGANVGLLLDKYARSYSPGSADGKFSEKVQRPTVEEVARAASSAQALLAFNDLRARRQRMLAALGAATFRAATLGPLTLHLARASALENAGICLHPIYGFAYLPGTGLKGMAHAYACECWLPAQPDKALAWHTICRVMGWAPAPWLQRLAKRLGVQAPADSRAGSVVFHDAWPTSCPKLMVDIVNNHHPDYYQANDNNVPPPGDWENPIPVYFLAVPAGQEFEFAVSKRRGDASEDQLNLAGQWLAGALCHLGAGAKTAAGYGAFKIAETRVQVPPLSPRARAVFETTLELVTPAFLAGASQQGEDCDLRPATLRGVLRWWWRTMHAGSVDAATLRRMEACIWGDTNQGGAVRIELSSASNHRPVAYDKRQRASMQDNEKSGPYGIPGSNPKKTTQGLWYISYGMDEAQRRRHVLEPGGRWNLRFVARATSEQISAQAALEQAKAALWLLGHFGGVGSKARKGFGSLLVRDLDDWNLQRCQAVGLHLREALGHAGFPPQASTASPALERRIELEKPVEFPWNDPWQVLDQVGFALQAFAKTRAHQREKMAMGLPRRIGRTNTDARGNFQATGPVAQALQQAARSGGAANVRHASPFHVHLGPLSNGRPGFEVRLVAFPAQFLPDLRTSQTFLEQLRDQVYSDLQRRTKLAPPIRPGRASSPPAAPSSAKVTVVFLGRHEKLEKAFWVQEQGKKRGLLKYGTPPSPLPAVNDQIEVYPTNNNPQSPEYGWTARTAPPSKPGSGGPPRSRK